MVRTFVVAVSVQIPLEPERVVVGILDFHSEQVIGIHDYAGRTLERDFRRRVERRLLPASRCSEADFELRAERRFTACERERSKDGEGDNEEATHTPILGRPWLAPQ